MGGRNPWLEWANSAEDEQGRVLNGFFMENAHRPARVPAEHSETAYMTRRAMQTITEAGDTPWCLHLSYIKPHWPLVAPAPYHRLYGADDVPAAVRSAAERQGPAPGLRRLHASSAWRRPSRATRSARARFPPTWG